MDICAGFIGNAEIGASAVAGVATFVTGCSGFDLQDIGTYHIAGVGSDLSAIKSSLRLSLISYIALNLLTFFCEIAQVIAFHLARLISASIPDEMRLPNTQTSVHLLMKAFPKKRPSSRSSGLSSSRNCGNSRCGAIGIYPCPRHSGCSVWRWLCLSPHLQKTESRCRR